MDIVLVEASQSNVDKHNMSLRFKLFPFSTEFCINVQVDIKTFLPQIRHFLFQNMCHSHTHKLLVSLGIHKRQSEGKLSDARTRSPASLWQYVYKALKWIMTIASVSIIRERRQLEHNRKAPNDKGERKFLNFFLLPRIFLRMKLIKYSNIQKNHTTASFSYNLR